MDTVDWRSQLPADYREKVVDKIINALRNCLPPSSEQHISKIKDIALMFEEKVYVAARSQKEYVLMVTSKLGRVNPSSSNRPYSGLNTSKPGGNQGQSIAVQSIDQCQSREQHPLPNVSNNIASGGVSAKLTSARPTVSVSAQVPLPNSASENSNSQATFGNSQKSVRNLAGHGAPLNISSNNLRQEQGRQLSPHIDIQQKHEQLNPHLCQQVKQESISFASINQQQKLQQHYHPQKKLLKPTQQQASQQSPNLRPSQTHIAPLSDLRQDQMSCFEQTPSYVIKNHPNTAFRQTNQTQGTPDIHQTVSSSPENLLMQSQKQPHVIGRKLTATDIQQSQLNGHPSGISDLHQQQPRLPCQQNNGQQWFQLQKSTHHEKSGERNNNSLLQQSSQLHGKQGASSGIHQCKVKVKEETQQTASAMLPNQGQLSQPQNLKRQLNSQSQPENTQQLLNPSEQDKQQSYQTSGKLTSTSEKRISCIDNWQEDVYWKVESLKSKFLRPLSDMLQRITYQLQQITSVSQQAETGNIQKLEALKDRLSRTIMHLNVPKSRLTPAYKDSLGVLERSIMIIVGTCSRTKHVPSLQHGQISSDEHSIRQLVQLQSQTPLVQSHPDEKKPQIQSVNLQATTTDQRKVTNLANDSKSLSERPTLQHCMMHLKNNEQYSGQENSLNSVLQVASGSLKIPTSSSQHPNIRTFLSQSPVNGAESNVNALESSCSTLQDMQLKQPKAQRGVQTQNPKQELQRQKIPQQIVGPVKLQSGASFPVALPKILGSSSKQVHQFSSQIDKKNLPMPLTKARTTFYPINSPSINISSLAPLASSCTPVDAEKPISDIFSLSNAANIGEQQVKGAPEAPSPVVISTLGMSTSPLLEESNNCIHCSTSIISNDLRASEQPIQRLIKVVNLMSSKALCASVMDIGSVVCATDRISRSPDLIGEDFVGNTNSNLQERYLTWQDKPFGTRKIKRCRSTVPMDIVPSAIDMEKFDLDSTAISDIKRPRIELNESLLEEITAINHQLIDTVLDISDGDTPPTGSSAPIKGAEGTIVRCSFIPVAISPNLKSEQVSAKMLPIQPLRLLIPANYPLCSPIFLDKLRVDISDELEDLSAKVKSKLSTSLQRLTEPLSLGEIARTWSVCAGAVISEFAEQIGGGHFSSKYGTWEDCSLSAAY